MYSRESTNYLNTQQEEAWLAFQRAVDGFLGNFKSPDFIELITNLLNQCEAIGAHLSLKMHFLKSHLNYFPDNLGEMCDEQGERFHQDISEFEERYHMYE